MPDWSQSPAFKWVVVLCCLVLVSVAAWRVFDLWRGPIPARIEPNVTVPGRSWGRPHRRQEATPVPSAVHFDAAAQ